jgi:pyrrolysine biosynthesis protein PylD
VKNTNPGRNIQVCSSVEECFSKARGVILAAPAANLVTEAMVDEDTVIAAPGIPLGLTAEARRKLPERNLIHEPLMLGVATMAVELLKPKP